MAAAGRSHWTELSSEKLHRELDLYPHESRENASRCWNECACSPPEVSDITPPAFEVLRAMITRAVLIPLVMFVGIIGPRTVSADEPCEVVPMPCTFESRPFRVIVVDAETGEPIGGVHAMAEWQVYGGLGRRNGPLMVKDAITSGDGVAMFEEWGPIEGPVSGMVISYDPGVTFFKPGYELLVVPNTGGLPGREHQRIRKFFQDGHTFRMRRFEGTPERWAYELSNATRALATPMADEVRLKFREPYLRRLYRVRSEREKLPEPLRSDRRQFGLLDGYLRLLEKN